MDPLSTNFLRFAILQKSLRTAKRGFLICLSTDNLHDINTESIL